MTVRSPPRKSFASRNLNSATRKPEQARPPSASCGGGRLLVLGKRPEPAAASKTNTVAAPVPMNTPSLRRESGGAGRLRQIGAVGRRRLGARETTGAGTGTETARPTGQQGAARRALGQAGRYRFNEAARGARAGLVPEAHSGAGAAEAAAAAAEAGKSTSTAAPVAPVPGR